MPEETVCNDCGGEKAYNEGGSSQDLGVDGTKGAGGEIEQGEQDGCLSKQNWG